MKVMRQLCRGTHSRPGFATMARTAGLARVCNSKETDRETGQPVPESKLETYNGIQQAQVKVQAKLLQKKVWQK
jgi:hypothetical protein